MPYDSHHYSYRMLGELLEIAQSKIGLKLPFPPIGSIPITHVGLTGAQVMANIVASGGTRGADGSSNIFGPYSGVNMALHVQHAGYYYWIAAVCSQERSIRFETVRQVCLLF